MTDLDEEARRIAAAHPWAGTATETHRTDWQPQHAVPRRPAPYAPTDADIEARVAMDLAAIDRELDPQAPPPVFGGLLTRPWQDAPRYQMTATDVLRQQNAAQLRALRNPWPGVQDWFAQNLADAYSDPHRYTYVVDPAVVAPDPEIEALQWRMTEKMRRLAGMYSTGRPSIKVTTDARGDVVYTPAPPKQRKPKTYVAPGRRQGKTWIARLEQSKQARKR